MFFRLGLLRKALIGAPIELVRAEFPPTGKERPESVQHLDQVCKVVVYALCSIVEEPTLWHARFVRDTMVHTHRGFSVEGIAMGLALVDLLNPFARTTRALDFAEDQDGRYRFLAYVGVGMALGRFNRDPTWCWSQMRQDMCEITLDGYGFARGFFHRKKYIHRCHPPKRVTGTNLRIFDQGLGRAIWFGSDNQLSEAASIVSQFPTERQHNLWSGIGMASTYSGLCDQAEYERMKQLSGDHYPALARGCTMACYQRTADQYIPDHAEVAARVFWNASVREVAEQFARLHKEVGDRPEGASPLAHFYDQIEREARTSVSLATLSESAQSV